jgi:hypothetical protein
LCEHSFHGDESNKAQSRIFLTQMVTLIGNSILEWSAWHAPVTLPSCCLTDYSEPLLKLRLVKYGLERLETDGQLAKLTHQGYINSGGA